MRSNLMTATANGALPLRTEEFWPDEIDEDLPDDPSEPEEEWLEEPALEDLEGFRRRGSPENPGF